MKQRKLYVKVSDKNKQNFHVIMGSLGLEYYRRRILETEGDFQVNMETWRFAQIHVTLIKLNHTVHVHFGTSYWCEMRNSYSIICTTNENLRLLMT